MQSIEREIQREAKIDKDIDKIVNRWLKQNRTFRRVDKRENSTAFFIFIRSDLSRYTFAYNEGDNETLDRYMNDDRLTIVFFKSTNPHDRIRSTLGHINRNMAPSKKFYTLNKKVS